MVWFVLLLFVLNFAVGFGTAVVLEWRLARARTIPKPSESGAIAEEEEQAEEHLDTQEALEDSPVDESPVADIPAEWLDQLEAESVETKSFVEASVQVLRLEVGRYRDQLTSFEQRVRQCIQYPDADELQRLLTELKQVNVEWLGKQAEATSHLGSRRGGLGKFEEVGGDLVDVLLDQTAQIETTCNNIDVLDFDSDVTQGCDRLVIEVSRLIDLAHGLRDRMQESLITIMRFEKRFDSLERRMQIDGWTGLLNRSGFEVALHEWWRDDPARQRLISVGLVDIDRLGRQNRKAGTRRGDALLGAFGRLIGELFDKDHGYTRAARFEGQVFAIFFGDTGPRNATSAIERVRQAVAATTFVCGQEEIELSVSCCVTEVKKNDTPAEIFKRLKKGLRSAKAGGGDQTALDEGDGPTVVEPPQFQVKGRVVRVEERI